MPRLKLHVIVLYQDTVIFSGIVPQSIQLARTYSYSNINGAEKSQNKFEQAGRCITNYRPL